MNGLQNSCRRVLLPIVGVLFFSHFASAQESPQELLERYNSGDLEQDELEGFGFLFADYCNATSGNPPMGLFGLGLHHLTLSNRTNDGGRRFRQVVSGSSLQGGVYFPPLQENDIVPLFGFIYRVQNDNCFLRISDEDLPEGTAVEEDSVVVLLRIEVGGVRWSRVRGGLTVVHCDRNPNTGSSYDAYLYLDSIESSPDTDDSGLVAVLRAPEMDLEDCETYRLEVGDEVTFYGRTFTVRNIVPRDEEQHLIGWIEFSSPR